MDLLIYVFIISLSSAIICITAIMLDSRDDKNFEEKEKEKLNKNLFYLGMYRNSKIEDEIENEIEQEAVKYFWKWGNWNGYCKRIERV